MWPISE